MLLIPGGRSDYRDRILLLYQLATQQVGVLKLTTDGQVDAVQYDEQGQDGDYSVIEPADQTSKKDLSAEAESKLIPPVHKSGAPCAEEKTWDVEGRQEHRVSDCVDHCAVGTEPSDDDPAKGSAWVPDKLREEEGPGRTEKSRPVLLDEKPIGDVLPDRIGLVKTARQRAVPKGKDAERIRSILFQLRRYLGLQHGKQGSDRPLDAPYNAQLVQLIGSGSVIVTRSRQPDCSLSFLPASPLRQRHLLRQTAYVRS